MKMQKGFQKRLKINKKRKIFASNECLGWETHDFNNVSFAFLSVVDSESVPKS